jgi:hypothetical protein
VALHVARVELRGHLERRGGGLEVLEAGPVDLREVAPQRDLQVALLVGGQALEHLAVGALEGLPVLGLRDHRVDGLEGLEERRVVVEDHVEAVDRLVVGLDLVAEQHRGGVVVAERRLPSVSISTMRSMMRIESSHCLYFV